jgi:copper chaperone
MSQTIELNVTGMTCDHCVRSVTNALQDVPGVQSASVSLESNSAEVSGDGIDTAALVAAVAEEGYEAAVTSGA